MTSSEIEMPGEVKADPAALMASLHLLPSPTPNLEIKYTKVRRHGGPAVHGDFPEPSFLSVRTGCGAGVFRAQPVEPAQQRDTRSSALGLLKSRRGLGTRRGLASASLPRGAESRRQRLLPKPRPPLPPRPVLRAPTAARKASAPLPLLEGYPAGLAEQPGRLFSAVHL